MQSFLGMFKGTPDIQEKDSFEEANKKLKTILESELEKEKEYTPDLKEWIRYLMLINQTVQMNVALNIDTVNDYNKKAMRAISGTLAQKNKKLFTSLFNYNIILKHEARKLSQAQKKELQDLIKGMPNVPKVSIVNSLQQRLNAARKATRGGRRSQGKRKTRQSHKGRNTRRRK